MNHEATLISLRHMTDAVQAEIVKLIPGPLPQQGTHGYQQIRVKCEEWLRRAQLIERSIKSRQALADMQAERARFTAHAYQAGQRQRSIGANTAQQRDAVAAFTLAVFRLWERLNGGMSSGEARAKGLNDAVKNIAKALETDQPVPLHDAQVIVEQADGPGPGGPPAAQFHPGLGTGLITLAIFVLTMLARRRAD